LNAEKEMNDDIDSTIQLGVSEKGVMTNKLLLVGRSSGT
jgi:hypothetical protein